MTDSNAPTRAPEVAPDLLGSWILTVAGSISPPAKDLGCIEIYYQVSGDTDALLFGSVNTTGPGTSKFALENGTLKANVIVQFVVTMDGLSYRFDGAIIDPQQMEGEVTLLLKAPGEPTEEGTWSAQAQGGGQD
jgi:hypothetical protein